jgi:hypothetical protein
MTEDEPLGLTIDDLLAGFEDWAKDLERKKLRRERPWTGDIIRVLWGVQTFMFMSQLVRQLWEIRNPSGLPMPDEFEKTIQSTLNQHTSQSKVWKKNGSKAEDDLFYSPKGKGSATWAVRREAAATWLRARRLPNTSPDPA